MNSNFTQWLQEQTFTLDIMGGWKVIKEEYNKVWNWNWNNIIEWDE
jgi:hypothetical protein